MFSTSPAIVFASARSAVNASALRSAHSATPAARRCVASDERDREAFAANLHRATMIVLVNRFEYRIPDR